MLVIGLSKRGYGTIRELEQLDTPDLLDLIEYEQIIGSIEHHEMEQARESAKHGHSQ